MSILNLRVGDLVEVRSKEEILATLDERGTLDALPFMPEMLSFCGKIFRVFKHAHKVDDRIERTGLRRLDHCVILKEVRCSGAWHGSCQAGCNILWKEAWLRRVRHGVKLEEPLSTERRPSASATSDSMAHEGACADETLKKVARRGQGQAGSFEGAFMCQATELRRATSYLSRWNLRQYVLDIWLGNITFFEFVRGMSIWLFNEVQALKGGCRYPSVEQGKLTKTPQIDLNLQPGEMVRVKTKKEIQQTLDTGTKNRGLWFDVEMVRYCGGTFRVLRRVNQIIDEKSGRMLHFRTVSIVLDGVTCRGDYKQFCPQNELIFWREIWLERVQPG